MMYLYYFSQAALGANGDNQFKKALRLSSLMKHFSCFAGVK